MTLKQVFIRNLKDYRKKEGFSQMKLAEICDTAHSYIGEIEVGRRFPSMEMVEKIAQALRVKPYHLFIDRTEESPDTKAESPFPKLPNAMKNEIKSQVDHTIIEGIHEILNRY